MVIPESKQLKEHLEAHLENNSMPSSSPNTGRNTQRECWVKYVVHRSMFQGSQGSVLPRMAGLTLTEESICEDIKDEPRSIPSVRTRRSQPQGRWPPPLLHQHQRRWLSVWDGNCRKNSGLLWLPRQCRLDGRRSSMAAQCHPCSHGLRFPLSHGI